MSQQVHYDRCVVCGSADLRSVFTTRDYTVSKKIFEIVECSDCTLRITQDVPNMDNIGEYYKADTYISHTNKSNNLLNRLYKIVRKFTLQQKRHLIEKETGKKNGRILDIGAGTGAFIENMRINNWSTIGIEPDSEARKVAKQDFNVELLPTEEFENMNGRSFDAITMWHVLEHVHDLDGYMKKLHSLLATNGRLFIAVPNYTSRNESFYKENWAGYDVPRHLYHFSPKSMDILAQKNGLEIVSYKPMWFDSFYVSMLTSQNLTGKVSYLKSFWLGLRSNIATWKDVKKCCSIIYVLKKG